MEDGCGSGFKRLQDKILAHQSLNKPAKYYD